MSKDSKNKKLLLGSALAGLMVAAPGISVTTAPTADTGSKFFQTVQLEVGYRLAEAGMGPDETGDKGSEPRDEMEAEKKEEAAGEKKDGEKNCSGDKQCSGDKKKDDAKTEGSKGCGAGSCG